MNCPNCGAENEVGARFCVECGAPLETQLDLPDRPPEVDDEDQDDRTILSSVSRIAEEAKTMAVTQDQLAAAEAEAASTFESGPELDQTPILPAGANRGGQSGGGLMSQRNIIIAVVVILLLLCCCCALSIGAILGSNPDAIEDLIGQLRVLPFDMFLI